MKSRSDSMLCWRNLWTVGVRLDRARPSRPFSPTTFLTTSATRHVLEGLRSCGCAAAGATCRRRARRSIAAELVNSGSKATISPMNTGDGLGCVDARRGGSRSRRRSRTAASATSLALGVGHADRRHVGQAAEVAHLDLLDVVHVAPGRAAAPLTVTDARGDVLAWPASVEPRAGRAACRAAGAGGCRCRWPRRRAASGSGRRRCWWAIDCSVSPSRTTWTPSPPSERVVGFVVLFAELALADAAPCSACVSASLTSARIGVPFGLNSW